MQAGTGTGKSLAYLVPAGAARRHDRGRTVVVDTATLALQAQVVDRDLPRLADAVAPLLGRRPTWQIVKGRSNYVCRHKLAGGFPAEDAALFDVGAARQRRRSAPGPTSPARAARWSGCAQWAQRDRQR